MGAISKREILTEHRLSKVTLLESDAPETVRFEAVVSEADFRNMNNRIYPEAVLFPAFEKLNAAIANGTAQPGLVDHPDMLSGTSVANIGIAWEAFWTDGKLVRGRGMVVPTAKGRDLAAAMEAGVAVGFSTRGHGTVEPTTIAGETVQVMRTYELDTVDAVVEPSVTHARLTNYTKEEIETMEQTLEQTRAALIAAEERVATLSACVEERETTVAVLTQERDSARQDAQVSAEALATAHAQIAQLTTELATLRGEKTESDLLNRLTDLTSGHRFGVTIRAKVLSLRESGVAVTAENIETLVAMFRDLVEAAGSAANEQAIPNGIVATDEDASDLVAVPADPLGRLSEEDKAELRAAGLL